MWGPIGGADNASIKLLKKSPLSSKFKFWIRNIINSLQLKYSHQLKRALSRTDLLLTATSENQTIFKNDLVNLIFICQRIQLQPL